MTIELKLRIFGIELEPKTILNLQELKEEIEEQVGGWIVRTNRAFLHTDRENTKGLLKSAEDGLFASCVKNAEAICDFTQISDFNKEAIDIENQIIYVKH